MEQRFLSWTTLGRGVATLWIAAPMLLPVGEGFLWSKEPPTEPEHEAHTEVPFYPQTYVPTDTMATGTASFPQTIGPEGIKSGEAFGSPNVLLT